MDTLMTTALKDSGMAWAYTPKCVYSGVQGLSSLKERSFAIHYEATTDKVKAIVNCYSARSTITY